MALYNSLFVGNDTSDDSTDSITDTPVSATTEPAHHTTDHVTYILVPILGSLAFIAILAALVTDHFIIRYLLKRAIII